MQSKLNQDRIALLKYMQGLYKASANVTQNPLYVWHALFDHMSELADEHAPIGLSFGNEVTVPGWIAEYIFDIAAKMVALTCGNDFRTWDTEPEPAELEEDYDGSPPLSASDAMKLVPLAMGFTRSTLNAFAMARSDIRKVRVFQAYLGICGSGKTKTQAAEEIQDRYALEDLSAARRLIRQGRQLIEAARVQAAQPNPVEAPKSGKD